MADTSHSSAGPDSENDQKSPDRTFLETMRVATPTERVVWLEEALRLAYASGALKPRKLLTQEEWEAMGSLPR